MESLNCLAKFGVDNGLKFITSRLKFDSNKPHRTLPNTLEYHTEPYPSNFFDEREIAILIDISKDYFADLAANPKKAPLAELKKILCAIMSQDVRTKEVGFDIQEHFDYFTKFIDDEAERKNFAQNITSKW